MRFSEMERVGRDWVSSINSISVWWIGKRFSEMGMDEMRKGWDEIE